MITALICTRDRGASAMEAVRSVLGNAGPPFTLLIVDQSEKDETRAAVEALADPRVRYLKCPGKGLAAARNYGIRDSRTDVIALTKSSAR